MQISYTYDNLDRVILEETDTTTYEYFYDSEGNLAKKVDKTTGKAVNYQYDSLGRLIHSYQSVNDTVLQRTEHIYDTSNRISSQSWQLGDTTYSESYTYDADDGSLKAYAPAAGGTVSYTYDALKRLSYLTNDVYKKSYTYITNEDGNATTQVASLRYANRNSNSLSAFTLNYSYDDLGNVAEITTGFLRGNASYVYDQQGQLTQETNYYGTYTYEYDTYGNIRRETRELTSGTTGTYEYLYEDEEWLDLLTSYRGHSISYDTVGNPTNWYNTKAWNFTWQNGRQLATATSSNTTVSYTYDVAGIRDRKTVTTSSGTVTYNYLTQNGQVVRQTWNDTDGVSHLMDFIYDNSGSPYAFVYDGTTYYYLLNLQGDVIRIVDESGATICTYTYDAWGRILYNSSNEIFQVNPIRYRGYYYDTETKLYYLQSRYYDPLVKRFVNADIPEIAVSDGTMLSKNLFAYCENCPTIADDQDGLWLNVVIGAMMGSAISAASTALTGGSLSEIAVSAAMGAISGGIAATGLGLVGQRAVAAITSAVDTAYQGIRKVRSREMNIQQLVVGTVTSAGIGALTADTGMNTAKLKTMRTTAKKATNVLKKAGNHPAVKRAAARSITAFKSYAKKQYLSSLKDTVIYTTFSWGAGKIVDYALATK